ncbi:MAG: AMP-binding protein [Deltaproteobacteria bacterium]|nr:AMP-binding protein [Deltaproteobacteria bacterium]
MNASMVQLPPEQVAIRGKCQHRSGTFVEFPIEDVETSIPVRFEKIVRLYPQQLAIKDADRSITYAELNAAANRIARSILHRGDTGAEPIIILIDKSIAQVAAIIGVLKAGRAFVLLDSSAPKARLHQIMQDCAPELVLHDGNNAALAKALERPGHRAIAVESIDYSLSGDNLGRSIAPDDLAFVVHTSGSTGRPKGVINNHNTLLHHVMVRTNSDGYSAKDRIAHLSSGTSNAITNPFFALLNGAALLMFDVKQAGIDRLRRWLHNESITFCPVAAPLFRGLCEGLTAADRFPQLRLLRLRSETVRGVDVELYQKHFGRDSFLATGLSSSESHMLTQFYIDANTTLAGKEVPVGYPVRDKEILLVDEAGDPVAPGETGEIVVRSKYLSPGYWRNPELSAAKFNRDPLDPNKIVYATGDLGLRLADGGLVHKGRKDFRVKIRGYGVELSEVERRLRSHDAVKDSVVVSRPNPASGAQLIAHVVAHKDRTPTVSALRQHLEESLPDYMLPADFVMLDDLPLTANGKINRQALREPSRQRPALANGYIAPRTPLEKQVVAIWADVLTRAEIGVDDNFSDLGGDSLLMSSVLTRLNREFATGIAPAIFFHGPTVAQVAKVMAVDSSGLQPGASTAAAQRVVVLSENPGATAVFCFPFRGGFRSEYVKFSQLSRYFDASYSFYGVRAHGADGNQPARRSLREIVNDAVDDIQSVQPRGPYYLLAECGGGIVAYATAQRLNALGEQVGLLGLYDTHAWSLGKYMLRCAQERLRFHKKFGACAWLRDYIQARAAYHLAALRSLRGRDRVGYFLAKASSAPGVLAFSRKVDHLAHLRALHTDNLGASGYRIEAMGAAEKHYYLAAHRCRFTPYAGPVVLLVNEKWHALEPTLGWRRFATGSVQSYQLPGDHDSAFAKNIPLAARILNDCLDKAVRRFEGRKAQAAAVRQSASEVISAAPDNRADDSPSNLWQAQQRYR